MLFAPLVDEVRWLAVAVFITAFRPIPLFDAYTTVKLTRLDNMLQNFRTSKKYLVG